MRFSALIKGKSPSHPKPIGDFGERKYCCGEKKIFSILTNFGGITSRRPCRKSEESQLTCQFN